jgi:hypothetical protein
MILPPADTCDPSTGIGTEPIGARTIPVGLTIEPSPLIIEPGAIESRRFVGILPSVIVEGKDEAEISAPLAVITEPGGPLEVPGGATRTPRGLKIEPFSCTIEPGGILASILVGIVPSVVVMLVLSVVVAAKSDDSLVEGGGACTLPSGLRIELSGT